MSQCSLLAAVEEVAHLAGSVALRSFGSGVTVATKADGSEVTTADRDAELVARQWIQDRFQDDGIVGEELGETNPRARRRWLIDPIDGTASFTRGVPLWGTLVAVAEDETVLAAAIFCPAVSEMLVAAVGEGCWWNGARARVSAVDRLTDAVVLTTDAGGGKLADGWRRLAGEARRARGWGDCYGYLLVATGRAEVMVDPVLSPWDSAALLPVIAEAGGVLTDVSGRVTAFGGSAVATNAALARSARAALGVPWA